MKKINCELVKTDSENLSWEIRTGDTLSGKVWLDIDDTDYLESPSIHIAFIEDGVDEQEIGTAAMKETIRYVYCNIPTEYLYSRFDINDKRTGKLLSSLGFEYDGKAYDDEDGLRWQNVILTL